MTTGRVLLLLTTLAACSNEPGQDATPTGYNVVLISLDSTRRDLLSAYGRTPKHAADEATSPNIDALASSGAIFDEAYATSSWTLPSHMSILSGQPEAVHGVDLDYLRSVGHPLLAETLRANGYSTAGFYSGPYLDASFGFGRGFQRYEACYGDALKRAFETQAAEDVIEQLSHRDVSSETVTDQALNALEEMAQNDAPFFLFAHYFDPHYDYTPPAPFDTRFDPKYSGSMDGTDFYTSPKISTADETRPGLRQRSVSERDLEHVLSLYEGELASTDAQIGRILERIDALDLRRTTLIVITADHGDEFFEHGSIGHRRTLYEEVVRTPLVFSLPGVVPEGARVKGTASTVDIVPTVLEILGLADPERFVSHSLLPRMRGEPADDPGAVGRLVVVREIAFDVPINGKMRKVPGRFIQLIETYVNGSIKITRERGWPKADGELPADVARKLKAQTRKLFAQEQLRWIDLEQNPDELEGGHRTDFSEPGARRALDSFRALYEGMLALRVSPEIDDGTGQMESALTGLGYADSGGGASGTPDEFLLPPPGSGQ